MRDTAEVKDRVTSPRGCKGRAVWEKHCPGFTGLTRAEFITVLGKYKVSPFQYTAEEVLEDLAHAD